MMSLSGGDERPRATLIVANDGTPMLNLQDEQGQPRISLTTSRAFGGSVVSISDKTGKVRLDLAVRDDGGVPIVSMRDKDAVQRVSLGVMPDGSGVLGMYGEKGSQRLQIGLEADMPNVQLFDLRERPCMTLALAPLGTIGLDVFTEEKRLSLGMEPEGDMSLRIFDKKKDEVVYKAPGPGR
jgi:hypothetical protein